MVNRKEQERYKEKKIKKLLLKKRRLLSNYKDLTDFKEPVLILMKRGNDIELFEDVKVDEFEFKHSSGTSVKLYLNQRYLHSFPYGKKSFLCYIAHEDDAFPYPKDPLFEIKSVKIIIEKIMNDIAKWKAKEIGARADLIKTIGLIAIGLIIAFILYRMLVPEVPTEIIREVLPNGTIRVLS